MSMNTGIVKFYIHEKGFGFITPDGGGKDIFVHASGFKNGELIEGAKVEFATESTERGLSAINVAVID